MTFEDVLDHAIAMLQRRGRVAYRTLKRQFQLDDEALDDLKGDGLLIYFGFPMAHEDDAQRAVYTELGIAEAMTALNARLEADYGVQLSVRIGIHTGPVVVGEMGGEDRHENLVAGATMYRGWALAMQGQGAEGVAQIHEALASVRVMGIELGRPYVLALLAEAYGKMGQIDPGLQALAEALEMGSKTGERWAEAELYRMQGNLLLRRSPSEERQAETCFHQALAVARHQQAKSWELRAAASLALLWQHQGKRAEARGLLAPVFNWFTEGFYTFDLNLPRCFLRNCHDERPYASGRV